MTIEQLIKRLEKLSGPDRETDGAIERVCFGEGPYKTVNTPYYTESINSALTLLPEGWAPTIDLYVMSDISSRNVWRTFVRKYGETTLARLHATASTPALSTAAAALRARAAEAEGERG